MGHTELRHFGVKGMRWGVRRQESTTSTSGGKGPKKSFAARHQKAIVAASLGLSAVVLGASIYGVNKAKARRTFAEAARKESVLRTVFSKVDLKNHYDVKSGANPAFVALQDSKLRSASAMVERMAKDPKVKPEDIIAELDKLRLG